MSNDVTATDYVTDDFDRMCDVCARPVTKGNFTLRDNVVICHRHPGYRRARELDAINARRKVPVVKPVKNTKPWNPLPTYEVEEGAIFDLVTTVAPYETFDVTSDGSGGIIGTQSFGTAGWAAVYLLALVTEARRPMAWRTLAAAKATNLCDFLIAHQVGTGVSPTSTASSDVQFGAFSSSYGDDNYLAREQGIACVALCKQYQATGSPKYLQAARNAANFIVNLMAGNLWVPSPSRQFYGPVTNGFFSLITFFTNLYYPQDLVCAWALSLVKDIAGDGLYGAPGTVGGVFTAAPQRLLSTAIAQQLSFWTNGAPDVVRGSTINGFSPATPYEYFDGSLGTWQYSSASTTISGPNWAEGLNALYQVSGATAQAQANYNYLLSFQSNTANRVTTGSSDAVIFQGTRGTYDPALAIAASLDVSAITETTTTGSLYDWSTAGMLAPFHSTLRPSSLANAKAELAERRHRTVEGSPRDTRTQYLGRLGISGLSFQPYTSTTLQRRESVTRAAKVGFLYRYRQAFAGAE